MTKKNLDNMKVDEIKYMIKKSKKLRDNLAGYSKMKESDLKVAVKKALDGEVISKRKTVESAWSKALKEFNKDRDSFLIPKKGSKDYDEVKLIMAKVGGNKVETASETIKVEKPKRSRVPKPKVIEDTPEEQGEDDPKMTKVRRSQRNVKK